MGSTVLIGLSLSMDAFAVSLSSGICIRNLKPFHAIRASFFFGLFQFIMPLAGWYLGRTFVSYIEAYDHWVAFILLALVGGRMIREGLKKGRSAKHKGDDPAGETPETEREEDNGRDIRSLGALLTLSLATSIDALAIGLSFSILSQGIWGSAALIGTITFLVCLTGFEFGKRLGVLFERGAPLVGGLILIGIGTKIIIEHLFF
ncbi:MAG: manganese efflux pump MntP family protein [Treponema sp.]|jgi:putative Mn2+ efflux pump MntP|nr:manganese efflux pump MntP family protein [Treponema sp.]